MKKFDNLFVILLLLSVSASAKNNITIFHPTFDEAVAKSHFYDGRAVSITGVAQIDENRFVVFRDEETAQKEDLTHSIFVSQHRESRNYVRFNRTWVEILGTMNADLHGPFGSGYPCEILLERITPIRPVKKKLWLADLGEFHNATSTRVRVEISTGDGGARFELLPSGKNTVGIHPGTIAVSDMSGKQLFKVPLAIPPRNSRADEPDDRLFAYVITKTGVALIASRRAEAGVRQSNPDKLQK
jgi:hypothetical protein